MNKDTKKKNSNSPATGRDEASSTSQQSAATSNDGRKNKRKASPDFKTPRKRARVSESEPLNTSEESLRKTVLKRKVREHGEGPAKKRTRKIRGSLDTESASTSTDTDKESSSKLLGSYETSAKDVVKRGRKRKAPADEEGPSKKTKIEVKEVLSVETKRAEFEAKYEEQNHLGNGGCGSVFAGYRKADNFPVAIKHIPKDNVFLKQVDKDGKNLSIEVAVMLKLRSGPPGTVGTSAPVSLLDWYDLDKELILVLERPVPSVDLFEYIEDKGGSLQEDEAKIILTQLVDAVKELEDNSIFHRDIKTENILIENSSDVPRVRLIDFGLSCFIKKGSYFRAFYGTSAHIPPEWYNRSTYRAGPTTVWQLGVVLFDSLHKRQSFETKRYLGSKLKISAKLSEDCQDFLRLCLTTIPERRPTLEELQLHPWLR